MRTTLEGEDDNEEDKLDVHDVWEDITRSEKIDPADVPMTITIQ